MSFAPHELEPGRCPICVHTTQGRAVARFDAFTYHACPQCGLWYLDPRPTEEAMARFYSSDEYFNHQQFGSGYQTYEQDKPQYFATFRRRLRQVRPFMGADGPVLDVGCGPGFMLEVLQEQGYEAWGLEFTGPSLDRARQVVGPRAVAVEDQSELIKNDYYAAVWLTDVIEHLYKPAEMIKKYHDWLRPGGILVMTTPNNRSLLARFSGKRWVSFKVPEHIVLYGRKSLSQLAEPLFDTLAFFAAGQTVSMPFLSVRLQNLVPAAAPLIRRLLNLRIIRKADIYVTSGSVTYVGRKRG